MAKKRSNGEGSIFFAKSKGLWVAEIYVDGSKKRKTSKKQSVVKEWLLKQREAIRDGVFVVDDSTRVATFLDEYVKNVAEHSLRPKTLEYYRWAVRDHINPMIGHLKLTDLRPSHIQKFYSAKLEAGFSKSTVRHFHNILHKTLDQAVRWGLVSRNVSDLVDPPSVKRPVPKIWDADQARSFLNHVKGSPYEPIFVLALATGIRRGEVLALHCEDVNWENCTIHIKRSLQDIKGSGIVISEPKTGNSKRTIKLPEFAMQVLRDHVTKNNISKGLLFTTTRGTPYSPRNVVRYFKEAAAEAGLPEIRFHDMRHTAASLLLMRGTHPKKVQELLGHSSIVLTLDTYSHLLPSAHDEVAEEMDAIYQVQE